jgi:23S rRNA (uracil1939-C5)-methyltransferase
MGHRGEGVADTPEGAAYVPYTLPGEIAFAERSEGHPDRRRLVRLETESPERIAPICPHFGVCGGCAVQHWAEPHYRAWKRDLVAAALAQTGLETQIDYLVDAHGAGRRRIVLHARRGGRDILQVGFSAPRVHAVVPIDKCPLLAPGLARAIPAAWKLAEAIGRIPKPLDLQFTATDAGLDVDLRGSGALAPALEASLTGIAAAERLARLTRHGELVAQLATPTVRMGRAIVPLPPGSFLQSTAEGEAALARLVLEHVGARARVADLFCGVGPFALRLAERGRVFAFDSDEATIDALRRAAAGASGLKPIAATARDLFRQPLDGNELSAFDAVVFDPPRQGALAQARELAAARVQTVIAVSCNPATFARDARVLTDGGYRLLRVTPIDQFRHSAHVELVGVFQR